MNKIKLAGLAVIGSAFLALSVPAMAAERPIGDPVEVAGMKVAAVYLQGVVMHPEGHNAGPNGADIHLEADIHALKGNPNGLGKGEWVPHLSVDYVLTKKGSDFKDSGLLVPMVANDGPHYGRNINMDGPGTYHLVFNIKPPADNGFFHHTSKETGVADWFKPFTQEWDFVYVGSPGKKGGY